MMMMEAHTPGYIVAFLHTEEDTSHDAGDGEHVPISYVVDADDSRTAGTPGHTCWLRELTERAVACCGLSM